MPQLQNLLQGVHMIQWKSVKADAAPRDLLPALSNLSLLDALTTARNLLKGPLVLFSPEARATILRHVSPRREESGGLLLGQAYVPSDAGSALSFPLVVISKAVPSGDYHGTSVSLHMAPSVWESVRSEAGLLVVGWFHSHPNLGAFFSGTDRKTQREFFPHEYSLGYVVDPIRDDHAYFIGLDASPVSKDQVIDRPAPAPLISSGI